MSENAYKAFKLPQEYLTGDKKEDYLPEDVLTEFFESDALGDKYTESLFAESDEMFDKADKTFEEGRAANNAGDKFSFAAVLYAVALFFAGIGTTLKSKVRWLILGAAYLIFVVSTGYVVTLEWLPLT
jgi:hypothetical protein